MHVAVHESSQPAEALMRTVLRRGRPIAGEYPLVFDPAAPGRVVTVEDAPGTVLSACAILVRELVTPAARFQAGLVGSVATDPVHRGRGYAGAALASSEEVFAREDCLFALLWADDPAYYQRRGYVPIGAELDAMILPETVHRLPAADGIRPACPGDAAAIHALYVAHPERVSREERETAALLGGPGMTSLVLERDGGVVAYACRGRGEDLRGTIHEWGGGAEDVLALVRAQAEQEGRDHGQPLVLMVPPGRVELLVALERFSAPAALGILGMGKLVSMDAAARLLGELAAPSGRVETDGASVTVHGPNGSIELNEVETLLTLVSPRLDRSVVGVVEFQTGLDLAALPLSPFVWGLDSI